MSAKPVPRIKSADTLVIENRLRETQIGEIVTYEELTKLLGRDVRQFCVSSLRSARHALITEAIFFDVIDNTGLRRLTSEEAAEYSTSFVRRARATSRRGLRHLQNVNFAELSDKAQQLHLTTSTQLGMIDLFGSSKSGNKISQAVKNGKSLPVGETLKLFGG